MTINEMQHVLSNVLPGNYGSYAPTDEGYQQYCDDTMELYDALESLDKLVERLDKYKWHDLRENPDDLPEYYKKVEVVYWDKETHEIDVEYRDFTHYGIPHPFTQVKEPIHSWNPPFQYFNYNYEIIAWREITPFEEVE